MLRSLAMAALAGIVGVAPATAQTLELAGSGFNEVLRPSAEISGAVVAGFQVHAKRKWEEAAPVPAPFKAVVPPSVGAGDVCVRVTSANGLYDSENEYAFSGSDGSGGAFVNVDHPTQYGPFFAGLEGEEVTVAIALGKCDDRARDLILASWEPETDARAVLYINSLRADTVVLRDLDRGETVRCREVEASLRSAYDTVCDVDIHRRTGPFDVEIVRFVNRSPAPPTRLTLHAPGF